MQPRKHGHQNESSSFIHGVHTSLMISVGTRLSMNASWCKYADTALWSDLKTSRLDMTWCRQPAQDKNKKPAKFGRLPAAEYVAPSVRSCSSSFLGSVTIVWWSRVVPDAMFDVWLPNYLFFNRFFLQQTGFWLYMVSLLMIWFHLKQPSLHLVYYDSDTVQLKIGLEMMTASLGLFWISHRKYEHKRFLTLFVNT